MHKQVPLLNKLVKFYKIEKMFYLKIYLTFILACLLQGNKMKVKLLNMKNNNKKIEDIFLKLVR